MTRRQSKSERRPPEGAMSVGKAGSRSSVYEGLGSRRAWISRWPTLAAALIVLSVVAAYSNSLYCPLVFDDATTISDNMTIRTLWPIWTPLSPPNNGATTTGRPLLNLTFAINYAVSGLNAWSYHAVNLLIHVLAALVLFGVVRRTLSLPTMQSRWAAVAVPLALVIALLWAVHPLLTESVTYIVQRAESLVGLFYLLMLYCVIRGATHSFPSPAGRGARGEGNPAQPQPQPTPTTEQQATSNALPPHPNPLPAGEGTAWYVAATLACLAGMAIKEVMVSAPLIVLLFDRAFLAGSFREALRRRYGLYFALAATWALLGYLVLHSGNRGGSAGFGAGVAIDWWTYLRTQSGAIVHYLRLAVWPHPLVFDYGVYTAHGFAKIVPYAIVVIMLGIATLIALWRWPKIGFLGAWFFAILAPTSSFVPVATQTIAEHRMYLPLVAVVVGIVCAAYFIGRRMVARGTLLPQAARVLAIALTASVVAVFAALTIHRNADYASVFSIWQDTVAKMPNNARAHSNMGSALGLAGHTDQAIEEYRKAITIQPKSTEAYTLLGAALLHDGRKDKAIAQYQKVVELEPKSAKAQSNLGGALTDCGRVEEALAELEKARQLDPKFSETYNNFGLALTSRGQDAEAVTYYEKAVELEPDYTDAHYNLGIALAKCGRAKEAVAHYQRVVRLQPSSKDACNNLARLLATHPDASVRNGAEAVRLAQRAVDLSHGQDPVMLDTLAAAYAEVGRFADALQTVQNATEIAQRQNQPAVVEAIRAKIPLYRAGKPYREQPSAKAVSPAGS